MLTPKFPIDDIACADFAATPVTIVIENTQRAATSSLILDKFKDFSERH